MTITDTEAKALALVNEICGSSWLPHEIERIANFKALCHYIQATEARHAAELREQAERFSEVAVRVKRLIEEAKLSRLMYDWSDDSKPSFIVDALAPFILPAPDPLVEAMQEWWHADGYASIETFRAAIEKRGGKIVWGEG